MSIIATGRFVRLKWKIRYTANVLAIRDPDGKLTPDLYQPGASVLGWTRDPFISKRSHYQHRQPLEIPNNPLKNSFRVFRALSQRGKGGVYQALDISVDPPRLCLVKEGRKSGEVWWDGRDGRSRLEQERVALTTLHRLGVTVPEVYSTFTLEGNFYLVTEYVEGENLLSYLKRRKDGWRYYPY
jgi:serine/threonine protein kinase